MCCEHRGHRSHWGHHALSHRSWCGCGCGQGGHGAGIPFRRRFRTREERAAWLEEYLQELQAEAKAVEERIARMKGTE
jgi:hypothetical protein